MLNDGDPLQTIIGGTGGITHVSFSIRANSIGSRDIQSYALDPINTNIDMTPTEGGSDSTFFFNIFKSGFVSPVVPSEAGGELSNAGPQVNTDDYTWDSKSCEGGTCVAGACAINADCDSREVCLDIDPGAPVVNRCLVPTTEFETGIVRSHNFQAQVDATWKLTQGGVDTFTDIDSILVTFAPEIDPSSISSIVIVEGGIAI